MLRLRRLAVIATCAAGLCTALHAATTEEPKSLNELQRDLVNLRFGMFIHLSPCTFHEMSQRYRGDHAMPRQGRDGKFGTADDVDPAIFNPTKLDCGQWADVAKSAGMKFGVLTTKHHDGFCLWPSKYSTYTVAQGCKRDVVGEFAQAFRSRGLKVGLYYSIRDRSAEIADRQHGGIPPEKLQFIKDQLTELLTQYGPILYIVFDAWGNAWHESPSFYELPYAEIYNHVKSLQPNCLVLNHSRLRAVSDVLQIELAAGMALPPGADWPAVGGTVLQKGWFWRKESPSMELKSVDWVIQEHLLPYNQRNIVFQLNCAPNPEGLMDENVVKRMAEIGKAWTPPAPLQQIPDSWKDWPVPASVKLFSGENVAKGKTVSSVEGKNVSPVTSLTDGDPDTNELFSKGGFFELDLGQSCDIAGVHLWNRPVHTQQMEQGQLLVSDKPFNEASAADVKVVEIKESPGYPTPYAITARGRYLRITAHGEKKAAIGEIEVFAQKK